MRPVRITGVTGNTVPIPLDTYAEGTQTVVRLVTAGAAVPQISADNPFDLSITAQWDPAPTKDATTGNYFIPSGIRAVRGSGMVPADVITVSQQGLL